MKINSYGLAWNPNKPGWLASGGDDGLLVIWDISAGIKSSTAVEVDPTITYTGHTSVVEDVSWHRHNNNLVGSVSDDKTLKL